jgi:ribosomal protein L16/L10AE
LRMGKGKGKLDCWFTNVTGGTVLFEFKNLRFGRSLFFMRQVSFKLGVPTVNLLNKKAYFNFPYSASKKVLFKTFW